jgi:uncharacterized protein (TIGR02594 family)
MDWPAWYREAVKDLGIKEVPGPANNKRILKLFGDGGFGTIKDETTPWCAIGLNGWLARAGVPGTSRANARSFLDWGIRLDRPVPGCIVVIARPPVPWQGHVGIYEGEDATHIRLLGANQNDSVSRGWFPKSRLIREGGRLTSYRWPKDVPVPAGAGPVRLIRGAAAADTKAA